MEVRSILKGLRASDGLLGESRVCVAVLDGPVNLAHPCFAGADVTRLDTLVTQAAGDGPMSVHGTHVASLIFGQPGSPVVGVAPRCRGLILPVFADACDSRVPQMDLARAIEQAVQAGAHIINISGGERTPDGHPDSMLERALRLCEERGVLVVAAVGNDGCDCLQAPAAAPSVLAVGASGIDGRPLDINNWGGAYRRNGVLAPGQDIEGADPGGGVRALTGSSFATPAASGLAALLVAAQLRRGLPPDPRAAGGAILDTASPPACMPEEAAHCRRFLVGTMNAARAYDLVTSADGPSGEHAGGLEHPQAYAGSDTAKGVNAAQPDLGRCGGITGARHIWTLAFAHNIAFAPHTGFSGGLSQLAALHVAAAAPSLLALEYMFIDNPCREIFVGGYPQAEKGLLRVPDGPGLGLQLDMDKIERYTVRH
ncbi:S8 family serine peptidase [Streptomyces sp. NPDC001027]|uniref:S8 family serine peptidase n=1 Tax=Streptomyces sp. NPDC001027 TaxID=3154771 RepID=UPI00333398FF